MAESNPPTADEIVEVFRSADVEARRRLLERCPKGKFTDMAQMAATFTTAGGNMQSLQFMVQSYEFGGPLELAARFGEACYRLGRETYDGPPPPNPIFLQAAGNGSVGWLTALSNDGRHEEARARGREVLQWLEGHGDTAHVDSVRLKLAEAAMGLGDLDEAKRILDGMNGAALPFPVNITYGAIRDRLDQLLASATTMAGDVRTDARSRLRRIFGLGDDAPTGEAPEKDAIDPDALVRTADAMVRLLGARDSEDAVMHRIVTASQLFRDPVAGRDPGRIAAIEPVLRAGRDWMRARGLANGENDACWGLYLCYSRTGRDGDAVVELQRIRANIEQARARVDLATDRAGLTAKFPQLYPCLVTLLYRLQRGPELLHAIEGSKGRALADVITISGGGVADDRTFAAAIAELPGVLTGTRARYVTYFVDDDCTYAAFTDGGDAPEMARLPLSRADIALIAEEIREAAEAGPRAVERMPRDLGERLAPLVAPLGELLEEGGHLCHSPDDVLHLLPLQAARLDGAPLVRRVSVSRVHGAHVLCELLRRPSRRGDRCVVVEAPARTDAEDPRRLEVFAKAGRWLREAIPGATVLAGTAADVGALARLDLRDALVHFGAHGLFPAKAARGRKANPYFSSGLLLAASGELPDLEAASRAQAGEHLLSPERLVREGLDFTGAHVTLQACVSGLSREGIGGDALGLEWALFQLGASSILSTHWNVSAQTSSAFTIRFHSRLTAEHASRAAAWRSTALEFLDRDDALANPYHWSAFSLSGDWR